MDPISTKDLLKLLESVLDAAKKAENDDTAERDRAVDGLNALAKAVVTTTTLAETQAGKRVRSLSKHSDEKIASGATKVVSCWKDLVRKESESQTPGGSQATASTGAPLSRAPSAARTADSGAIAPVPAIETQPQGTEDATQTVPPSQSAPLTTAEAGELDISEIPTTGDTVRDKVRTNLVTALHRAFSEGADCSDSASGSGSKAAIDIGVGIELALYAGHNGVSAGYKAKFRQLHFNLKDDKNPDLRRRVLEGIIPPDVLITLTPEELASDAKREENDRIREKKLFDAAPSSVKLATTDQFQCGKCKQRKTTYYQMQTRSADEPMTTFVRCVNCGNAWKFC